MPASCTCPWSSTTSPLGRTTPACTSTAPRSTHPPSPWLGLGLANPNLGQPSHLLAGRARRFYQT
eukprot:scaffold37703_cov61-Phaeocystis_antarctica.AAC.4